MSKVKINSYDQLLSFFEENDLTSKQMSNILLQGIKVIVLDEERPPEELIEAFRVFVMKYGNKPGEKPLFLDCPPLDVQD